MPFSRLNFIISLVVFFAFNLNIYAQDNHFLSSKNLQKISSSSLKIFKIKIYDIDLWSNRNFFSYDNNIAIEIKYLKNISKIKIIESSISEINKQKKLSNKIKLKYNEYLNQSLVNIKKNDIMTAIYIDNEISFYLNNKLTNSINDKAFAIDFLNIWLGKNSSYPKITKQLISHGE